MKRYWRESGKEFVQNGGSIVQTSTMRESPSLHPGRIVKIMLVQKVVKQRDMNPIGEGMMLGISFPEQKINSQLYEWEAGEEFQVPFRIQIDSQPPMANHVEGDPEPSNE